jgi:hypothetical protein
VKSWNREFTRIVLYTWSFQIYMKEGGMKAWGWCSHYFRVGRGVQIDLQCYVCSLHTVDTDKIFTWYHPVRLQQVFRESSKIFISGSTAWLEISSVHAQRSKDSALLPAQRGTWYTCIQGRKLKLVLWRETARKFQWYYSWLLYNVVSHITGSRQRFVFNRAICWSIIAFI